MGFGVKGDAMIYLNEESAPESCVMASFRSERAIVVFAISVDQLFSKSYASLELAFRLSRATVQIAVVLT